MKESRRDAVQICRLTPSFSRRDCPGGSVNSSGRSFDPPRCDSYVTLISLCEQARRKGIRKETHMSDVSALAEAPRQPGSVTAAVSRLGKEHGPLPPPASCVDSALTYGYVSSGGSSKGHRSGQTIRPSASAPRSLTSRSSSLI